MPGPSNTLTYNQNFVHFPSVFVGSCRGSDTTHLGALEPEIVKVPSKLREGTEDLDDK